MANAHVRTIGIDVMTYGDVGSFGSERARTL